MSHSLKRTHFCGNLREENIGESVRINGWVAKSRNLGSLIFADIRDYSGIVQVVFDETIEAEVFERATSIRSEYVVAIEGTVRMRSSINDGIPTGKIEILVNELEILNESDVPPIYIRDDDDVTEMVRLKNRTLDLRKPHMQEIFRMRSQMYKITRDYFYENGFVEIETPILSKPTPEGARDYLVPSRVQPGAFYALPQSPQLMKQLLMVSGFDRYIQITKCFRDEDLRFNRQPEFTQIDMELSFVDEEDVMSINENYLKKLFKEIKGIELETPFQRMTYKEAMDRYGVDKPDTRFEMELQDVSEIVKEADFKVFQDAIANGGSVRCIVVKGGAEFFSRKKIDKLEAFVKDYGAKGLAWAKVNEGEIQSPIKKFIEDSIFDSIIQSTEAEVGDLILFVADKNATVFAALGNLRNHIASEMGLIDKEKINALWIIEFPLFEFDEEENRYVAKHHPFTAPMKEDVDLLESDPENCRARAYDIVINGDEMGGGSIRIHKREDQEKMFQALGFSQEEAQEKFGFLLEAFRYGAPPHGGLAFGLDRLCMLLTGEENMRQVIAFPKTQSATDLLTGAPVHLSPKQLEEVHIKTLEEE
ncbi:aspartate--tRNA ligase [Peptoniphilus sp. KCTC 25270]|uniref:aspartate--tRNA ligase n=1 Tax=Peptoniphilus sp. KCTC 25270 TaxID=2897414 RepID=UPI001E59F348|nr:aspartate--tRNA ligase [Peptoniphilus sp. KCTC 25270]MCD1147033.1 aspartate--tRNA ligase [Peptoniphilus sp. KCTC 25270]